MSEDKPRSFLTKEDRKYLEQGREGAELTPQSEYNTKRRIRNRVRQALIDFSILWEHWEMEEMWKVRSDEGLPLWYEEFDDPELADGLRDVIVFSLFLAEAEPLFDENRPAPYGNTVTVDELLLNVFKELGAVHGRYVRDYELTIESDHIKAVDIVNRLKDGEDVPMEQLAMALESDVLGVDAEPIKEMFQEEVRKQLSEREKKSN